MGGMLHVRRFFTVGVRCRLLLCNHWSSSPFAMLQSTSHWFHSFCFSTISTNSSNPSEMDFWRWHVGDIICLATWKHFICFRNSITSALSIFGGAHNSTVWSPRHFFSSSSALSLAGQSMSGSWSRTSGWRCRERKAYWSVRMTAWLWQPDAVDCMQNDVNNWTKMVHQPGFSSNQGDFPLQSCLLGWHCVTLL